MEPTPAPLPKPRALAVAQIFSVLLVLGAASVVIVAALRNLRDYPTVPYAIIAGAVAAAVAGLIWLLPRKRGRPRTWIAALAALSTVLVILPLSTLRPGGITTSGFGYTVVGACPIPAFDFTISGRGTIAPRNKTHHVTAEEVRPLAENADEVVIGTGWQGVAEVDADVLRLPKVTVHVMKTPEAFELYNRLRKQGKRVALLAHTTC
ncbi:MAG: hypothetical protein HYY17_06680 [Planctomycetes bacterium]|nr:hypothetical protein [Planctomycetota bacterium]